MAISTTPVQQQTGVSTGSSATYTIVLTSAPTNGNTLILTHGGGDLTNHPVSSLSQTGVTWTKSVSSNTNQTVDIWYGVVGASASATLNLTLAGAGATVARDNLSEWSGLISAPADQASAFTGNSNAPAAGPITPVASRNILLIAVTRKGGTGTVSSPFTALTTADGSFKPSYQVIASSTGTYTANWTWSSTTLWDALIADYLGVNSNFLMFM